MSEHAESISPPLQASVTTLRPMHTWALIVEAIHGKETVTLMMRGRTIDEAIASANGCIDPRVWWITNATLYLR